MVNHVPSLVQQMADTTAHFLQNRRSLHYALLSIMGAGFFVRVRDLNYHALWYDEMMQAAVAQAAWKDVFGLVSLHSSPPLDYVLTKLAMLLLGNGDWAVRMPAFVLGVAAIYVMYRFARSIAGSENALIAAALLALSPMAIVYSQEARMYSLFLFLSLLSYLLTLFFIERNDLRTSVWLGIVNGLLILSHYFGICVIAGEGIILLAVLLTRAGKGRRAARMAVSLVISFVVFLPWLPFFLSQLDYTGGEIGYALRADRHFFKPILSSFTVFAGRHRVRLYAYLVMFLIGAAFAWRNREQRVMVIACSVAGMVCALFGTASVAGVVTPRNAIFLLPLFLLVCAHGFHAALQCCKMPRIAGMLVLLLAFWGPAAQASRSVGKINWRDAAAYIRQRAGADEKVVTSDFISRGCLAYYLDPEADYVIMRERWRETVNEPGWKIWIMDEGLDVAIKEKRFSGWAVIPPSALLAVTEEQLDAYNARMGQPVKQFRIFDRSLNIYRLPGEGSHLNY